VEYFVGTFRNLVILWYSWLLEALLTAGPVTTGSGVVTLREMTTYVVISSMIGTLLTVDVIFNMNDRIRNGQIGMDLVKAGEFPDLYIL